VCIIFTSFVIDDAVVISLTERDAIQSFTVRRFFSIFSRLFLSLRILSFRSLIGMAHAHAPCEIHWPAKQSETLFHALITF
jgi:hypothetical protein